ncbi:MAG TPA: hypothetical protein VNY78_04895 [Edaphobacter sp.]|nr:hypothetical protein [Edaphobacter sp.]
MRKMFCTLVLLAFATPLLAIDPFTGTWTLNSAKTKYTTGTPPRNVTIVIEEQGANLMVTATGNAGDGSPISVKYMVPVKGGMGSVEQGDFDGISAKQVSAHVRENSYMKGGKQIRTRRMTVSDDGKTMKSVLSGTGADGKPAAGVDFYDKQ